MTNSIRKDVMESEWIDLIILTTPHSALRIQQFATERKHFVESITPSISGLFIDQNFHYARTKNVEGL